MHNSENDFRNLNSNTLFLFRILFGKDYFCEQKSPKNPDKTGLSIRNILFAICVGRVSIETRYFLIEKQALIGLSKFVNIQKLLLDFL